MQLGFSNNEAKVYLALVTLGSGTTSDITKESGVHRVNVYEIIDKLANKGLVSSLKKATKSIYSVGDPKNLLRFIEQKEEIAILFSLSVWHIGKFLDFLQIENSFSKNFRKEQKLFT